MKTIKNIINNLMKLEFDFDILNSRILEFANSTNKTDIDFDLVNKYINGIEKYQKLLKNYKTEVNQIQISKEEYKAQKVIVDFRITKLEELFNNTLRKLTLISSISEEIKVKKEEVKVDFGSLNEVTKIKLALYEFYDNYEDFQNYQRKFNINLSLDDKFENLIEKKLKSEELISSENKYLNDINTIFEEVIDLNEKFKDKVKEASKIEKHLFYENILVKTYKNFLKENFYKIFDFEYLFFNFNIEESVFYSHFKKFKNKINNETKKIIFIKKIILLKRKINKFNILSRKYNLLSNQKEIINISDFISKFKHRKFRNYNEMILVARKEISNSISSIYNSVDFFVNSLRFLDIYSSIYETDSKKLNYGFLDYFVSPFSGDETHGEIFIRKGLVNLKKKLEVELKKGNGEEKIIKKYVKKIEKIKKYIKIIDSDVSKTKFKVGNKVSYFKKSALSNLYILEGLFGYKRGESMYFTKLKIHIFTQIKRMYDSSKSSYYSGSSSYGSSSYSSSSSSSSRSSSSSSYSSSYSSSGSSSW